MIRLIASFLIATTCIAPASIAEDPSDVLAASMAQTDDQFAIGAAKLAIDELIDPTIDSDHVRTQVRALANATLQMAGLSASDTELMVTMRTVLYEPGWWNDNRPFSYDHNDPQGQDVTHKTMGYYLESRLGNCVTMPILILMIGEVLGLDMTLTTAPQHLLVHFNPKEGAGDGDLQRIEGTSGGYPQRLSWMRQVFPSVTDTAISNGVYFAKLDTQQSIALTGETLLQKLFDDGDQNERIEVAELMLEVYPNNDIAIMHRIDAYDRIIRETIVSKYPRFEAIPAEVFPEFERMAGIVQKEEERLRRIGWIRSQGAVNPSNPR